MPMPYGFYPSPNQMFFPPPMGLPAQQVWPPQQPPFCPQPAPQLNAAAAPPKVVKGPAIGDWLRYCDFHPDRQGEDFQSLQTKFDDEGFRNLFQLTSGRTTIEKLSGWLDIRKGTADLIIGYADEDIALVREGKFTMDLSNLDNGEGGSGGSGGWA